MTAPGRPKQRFGDLFCRSQGKQTFGELPDNDAYDPELMRSTTDKECLLMRSLSAMVWEDGMQLGASCAGFRMTAHRDGAACTGAVVRKPPRNEPAGEVRGGRSGLSYGDLGDAEGVCEDCNGLEGEQWRVWWEAEAGVDG